MNNRNGTVKTAHQEHQFKKMYVEVTIFITM